MSTGYLLPGYAGALSEFGMPCHLAGSDSWVLQREIPESDGLVDAIGCYPIFSCRNWSKAGEDLDQKTSQWVAFSCVPDPFGTYTVAELQSCFSAVTPFKEHFIVECGQPLETFV